MEIYSDQERSRILLGPKGGIRIGIDIGSGLRLEADRQLNKNRDGQGQKIGGLHFFPQKESQPAFKRPATINP
jgi:hypothetical protein